MPTINKFEDLEVWQLARKVEQFTFELTKAELLSKDFKLKKSNERFFFIRYGKYSCPA